MALRLSAHRTGRALLPQKHFSSASRTHFCKRLSEPQGLVWPAGLGKSKKKNLFTSSGLEPSTFRLVPYATALECTCYPDAVHAILRNHIDDLDAHLLLMQIL
jgi:hypothetical protein